MALYGGQMSWLAAFCPGSFYPVIIFWCEPHFTPHESTGEEDKRCTTGAFEGSEGACWNPPHLPFYCPKRSRGASCSKDVVKLAEDEFHRLVLVNHIHRHVAVVLFWTHQGRSEHDADVLGGHSVGTWLLQHSVEGSDTESINILKYQQEITRTNIALDHWFWIVAACGYEWLVVLAGWFEGWKSSALGPVRNISVNVGWLGKSLCTNFNDLQMMYSNDLYLSSPDISSSTTTMRLTFVGFEWNVSTTIGWIAMTFGTHIQMLLGLNLNNL